MGNNSSVLHLLLLLALHLQLLSHVKPDPDPLQDYCVADTGAKSSLFINGKLCINPALVTPSNFYTSALSKPGDTKRNPFGYNSTFATTLNLPGLNTMGLGMSRVDLAPNGIVPPHSHPRASEVAICLQGQLLVGFVDTSYRLFSQSLRPGDSFVFPKALIHFVYNVDLNSPALFLSGFSCQNPGVQLAAIASFTSKPPIPDVVVEKAFQITAAEVSKIRKSLGG